MGLITRIIILVDKVYLDFVLAFSASIAALREFSLASFSGILLSAMIN